VVIISLADFNNISKQLIYILPTSINFEAYKVIMKGDNILNAFLVSVFVTVIGTAFNMFLSVTAAYGLSKKAMPGRNALLTIVVFTMFFSGGLIPYYLTVKAVGLVNNILVLIIPLGINTFNLIIMKNFFTTIPPSLEESAKIDGANDLYVLWKVVLPTSAPILATITLFYAVDRWNEWWHAMLFISNRDMFPLQMVLREILFDFSQMMGSAIGASIRASKVNIYPRSVQMAIVVVTAVPILLVYPFLQKHFTKGILLGSLKE
jgi:putative aldouronate transport system permease protein